MKTKLKKKLLGLLLLIICFGCKDIHTENVINTIKIDPLKSKKPLKFSELFAEINYTKLQTSENCLIGQIDKIEYDGNWLFIKDEKNTKSVFVFDKSGKHISTIKNLGKGPGEYLDLTDFTIDHARQNIIIFCGRTHKIIRYDFKGKYVDEYKTEYWARSLQYLSPNKLVFFCDYIPNFKSIFKSKFPNIFISTNTGKTLSRELFFSSQINSQALVKRPLPFSVIEENEISLLVPYNDTIYHFKDGKIKRELYIDFGAFKIDNEFWEQVKSKIDPFNIVKNYMNQTGKCQITKMFETKNYIFFIYNQKSDYHYVFYSKATHEIIDLMKGLHEGGKPIPLINDFDMVSDFLPMTSYQDKLYYIIETSTIIKMKNQYKGNDPKLLEIINNSTDYDNPIIAEVTLKNF